VGGVPVWGSLLLALAIGLLVSFLPGFFLCRALQSPGWISAVAAIPTSCGLYSIAGVILYRLGHPGALPLLGAVLSVTVACAALQLARRFYLHQNGRRNDKDSGLSPATILLYLGVVTAVVVYAFLSNIGSADSVNQASDNPFHLTRIADMAQYGNFSMLDTSFYNGVVPDERVLTASAGFYPEAFHVLAALTLFITNVPVGIAENATTLIFICIVYPLGLSALMQNQFGKHSSITLIGAFCACACVMFPIRPLVVNGTFPFTAGLACLPAMLFLFTRSFDMADSDFPQIKRSSLLSFFVALLGLATLHPSAAIASSLAAAPFIISRLVPPIAASLPAPARHIPIAVWQCASFVLFALLWIIVYNLPFLASITSYSWGWNESLTKAIELLMTMGLRLGIPSYAVGFFVILGLIQALSSKRSAWLGGTFLMAAVIFLGSANSNPLLAHLLSGFWYTDPERTSALVAITAAPLCALGLAAVCEGLSRLTSHLENRESSKKRCRFAASVVTVLVFAQAAYSPTIPTPRDFTLSGYGQTEEQIRSFYSKGDALPYSQRERDFVEKVIELLPDDSVVASNPFDGSVLANPLDGLNIVYRSYFTIGGEDEPSDSVLVRKNLNELASSEEVASAAKRMGIQYVLQLSDEGYRDYPDNSDLKVSPFGPTYAIDDWKGIDGITESTPGFEVILSDGDMKLYKIVGDGKESDG